MPSSLLYTYGSWGKIDLIVDNQHFLGRISIIVEKGRYGQAAFIHEGGGFEKTTRPSLDLDPAFVAKEPGGPSKCLAKMGGNTIHEPKTGVVACHGVTRPRITKSDD